MVYKFFYIVKNNLNFFNINITKTFSNFNSNNNRKKIFTLYSIIKNINKLVIF